MRIKDKQKLFDAITKIGYKETEILLINFLDGEAIIDDEDFKYILYWFNHWYNKGEYQSDIQSVISFIQANTYTNPSKNTKKTTFEVTDKFREEWKAKFGSYPIE